MSKFVILFFFILSFNSYAQLVELLPNQNINSTEINQNFSILKKQKFIQRYSRSTDVRNNGSTYSYLNVFTFSGLDTTKKYRIKTPTHFRLISGSAGVIQVYVGNKIVSYFYPAGAGELTENIDFEFTPENTNEELRIYSRNTGGIVVDFENEIKIDLFEIVDQVNTTSNDIIEAGSLNNLFEQLELKEILVNQYSLNNSAVTFGNTMLTLSDLDIGQRYKLSFPIIWFGNSSCAANPTTYLKLNGLNFFIYKTPGDGYHQSSLEQEFTATSSSMALTVAKGSPSCATTSSFTDKVYLYKMQNNSEILNIFDNNKGIKSFDFNDNFNKAKKKNNFITNFNRSSNVVPTSGSTYVSSAVLTISNLTVGKKYILKTPTYFRMTSSSGSAATRVSFQGVDIATFYSNTGSSQGSIYYMKINHEFIAQNTSANVSVSSRVGNGILLDFENKIQLDLYEVID